MRVGRKGHQEFSKGSVETGVCVDFTEKCFSILVSDVAKLTS